MSLCGFETIDFTIPIKLWCSGGRDSTAMALLLYEYLKDNDESADVSIITTYTHYNQKCNLETIDRLAEYTGFRTERVFYTGKIRAGKIMNMSFKKIPRALRGKLCEGIYSVKKFFPCCKILKHKPARDYLRKMQKGEVLNMMGFKRSDKGPHRGYRLDQIRQKHTFYRSLSEFGYHLYFYPLRDLIDDDIDATLSKHGFGDIKSSGCRICPLFMLSKNLMKKDPVTFELTKNVMVKLGVDLRPDDQASLLDMLDIDEATEEINEIQRELGEYEEEV